MHALGKVMVGCAPIADDDSRNSPTIAQAYDVQRSRMLHDATRRLTKRVAFALSFAKMQRDVTSGQWRPIAAAPYHQSCATSFVPQLARKKKGETGARPGRGVSSSDYQTNFKAI